MAKYGIIYVIRNDLHPSNVYKIGYTTTSIHERLRELNRETSNPGEFRVCGYFPVNDVTEAEKLCHQTLEHLGLARRKEFFSGSISRILAEVEKICSLFQPTAFISREHLYDQAMSDRSQGYAVTKCTICSGSGKTRIQHNSFTSEFSCSNCGGTGMVLI